MSIAARLLKEWSRLGLLVVTVLFWLWFAATAPGFLSDFNLFTMLRFAGVQIVIGFAQLVALSIGEMNLAVGAIGGAVAMFAGGLMQALGVPPLLATLLAVALGGLLGTANGLLVVRTGINSFVITLGTSSVITGAMLIITRAQAFDTLPPGFVAFGKARVLGLPISPLLLVALLVAGLLYLLYRNTALGRELLAFGANRRAATMSGVSVPRAIVVAHALSGALAGLAGVLMIAMLGSAVPVVGSDWLLASFAIPAIGGTLISGGGVSVLGTLLGGVLINTITSGVLLMNVSNFWINLFLGLVLLIAVGLDRLRVVLAQRTLTVV